MEKCKNANGEKRHQYQFFTIIPNMENMGGTRAMDVEWEGKPMDYNPVFQTFDVEMNFVTDIGLTLQMGQDLPNRI